MRYTIQFSILACVAFVVACSPAKGDRTGHEYMPDMTHTTGYEANLYDYYYYNRWGTEAEYKKFASPRTSVHGTVARGQIAVANATDGVARMDAMAAFSGIAGGSMAMTPNGSVPYYYARYRGRTYQEQPGKLPRNPFPITEAGLAHGKELYVIYCGICHGEKGDGLGYLVAKKILLRGLLQVYIRLLLQTLCWTPLSIHHVGRFYHGIMYGKNVMGSYADKLSYQERWEVIHYIRSLQAQAKKAEYSAKANTFNSEATPWAIVEASMKHSMAASCCRYSSTSCTTTGAQQHTNQH